MTEIPPADNERNTFAGQAESVVQAGTVQGDVHIHQLREAALPTPRQLPSDVTHFTGRHSEQDMLDAVLKTDPSNQPTAVVISAIAGAAGIGKTSLAVHWAHRVRHRFPDGELYTNLRGYDRGQPVTPDQALNELLRALGVLGEDIPNGVDAKAGLYRSLLATRRMLIVLDNAATAEQVRPLLPGSPTCATVVTSRNRLSGLVARDGAHRITLDVLPPGEAITLLRGIIGANRADREPEALASLARWCAHLPLALRIAGERVAARPHLAVMDVVEAIAEERLRLDTLTADDDESTTMRTVLSWSYQALPSAAARLFRLVGLHPGPHISIPAATALSGASMIDTRQQIEALTSVHMLAETARDRYQLHDLLRDYAAERAAIEESADERTNATRRVLEWYLHTAQAALFAMYPQHPVLPFDPPKSNCHPLSFSDHDDSIRWYSAEYDNLIAAVHCAADIGQYTISWQLPNVIDTFCSICGQWADLISIYQRALASAEHLDDPVGKLMALSGIADTYRMSRLFEESRPYYQRELVASREIGDRRIEGFALLGLGHVAVGRNNLEEAIAYFRQALNVFREINNQRGIGIVLTDLGDVLRRQEKLNEAVECTWDALAIFRDTKNPIMNLRHC